MNFVLGQWQRFVRFFSSWLGGLKRSSGVFSGDDPVGDDKELERLLDKVSIYGFDNLSASEQRKLTKISDRVKERKAEQKKLKDEYLQGRD